MQLTRPTIGPITTMTNTNPSERHTPMWRYLLGISSGIEHMAIWQNPPPNPVIANPAVNCMAPWAVAEMTRPRAQMAFPAMRNMRRPKRSLFVPARRNPMALPVVYAGTVHGSVSQPPREQVYDILLNHATARGSPN